MAHEQAHADRSAQFGVATWDQDSDLRKTGRVELATHRCEAVVALHYDRRMARRPVRALVSVPSQRGGALQQSPPGIGRKAIAGGGTINDARNAGPCSLVSCHAPLYEALSFQ